jgi:hypothetical protein
MKEPGWGNIIGGQFEGPCIVRLINVGTVYYQRYQCCENTEHEINGRTVDSRNIDISTAPLTFCMVKLVDQFSKTVNLIKINCQVVDITTRILEM